MPPKEQKAKQPSALKTAYLILYNAVSAAAWSVVLARTAGTLAGEGYSHVFPAVGEWTKWTQTVAALEIMHSLLGTLSNSPPPPSNPSS